MNAIIEKDYLNLIDFKNPGEFERWQVINDLVMGGLSEGSLTLTGTGTVVFEGSLSLENSGGFTSVRTLPGYFNLSGYEGLVLRIRGDGKVYRLRVSTEDLFDGFAYQIRFESVKDTWINAHEPFNRFVPFFRGRIIDDAPELNPSSIRRIGFMIADGQAGSFRLEIDWVKAYRKKAV